MALRAGLEPNNLQIILSGAFRRVGILNRPASRINSPLIQIFPIIDKVLIGLSGE